MTKEIFHGLARNKKYVQQKKILRFVPDCFCTSAQTQVVVFGFGALFIQFTALCTIIIHPFNPDGERYAKRNRKTRRNVHGL